MSALRWLGCGLAALLAAGCQKKDVTPAECDRLLDKYTELRLRSTDPKVSGADVERARVEARAQAKLSRAFHTCTKDLTRESMDCALGSFHADEIERCLIPMP